MVCDLLGVSTSGYFAHLRRRGADKPSKPGTSQRISNEALLAHIRAIHAQVRGEYGWPKMWKELVARGIRVGKERVRRTMQEHGIKARGKRKFVVTTDSKHDLPIAPNLLQRNFTADAPNQVWTGDITYIATDEGWLYLAVVLDLFSRQVIGWSMGSRIDTDLVLNALLMALWRRQPKDTVLVHSDQGCQFTGHDWQGFLRDHNLVSSMSRRGNCHDNAVAESFFQLLKRERIRRQIYPTRQDARADVFNYIEMFYNPKRRHGSNGGVSPVEFERQTGLSGL